MAIIISFNSETDTIANKRRVSQVISHELSHQWFGNLVSERFFSKKFEKKSIIKC